MSSCRVAVVRFCPLFVIALLGLVLVCSVEPVIRALFCGGVVSYPSVSIFEPVRFCLKFMMGTK